MSASFQNAGFCGRPTNAARSSLFSTDSCSVVPSRHFLSKSPIPSERMFQFFQRLAWPRIHEDPETSFSKLKIKCRRQRAFRSPWSYSRTFRRLMTAGSSSDSSRTSSTRATKRRSSAKYTSNSSRERNRRASGSIAGARNATGTPFESTNALVFLQISDSYRKIDATTVRSTRTPTRRGGDLPRRPGEV